MEKIKMNELQIEAHNRELKMIGRVKQELHSCQDRDYLFLEAAADGYHSIILSCVDENSMTRYYAMQLRELPIGFWGEEE
tara:strand:+ start:322 stop:561 length:240 start_codon:yes stop_codon:yes gene_type:complete